MHFKERREFGIGVTGIFYLHCVTLIVRKSYTYAGVPATLRTSSAIYYSCEGQENSRHKSDITDLVRVIAQAPWYHSSVSTYLGSEKPETLS